MRYFLLIIGFTLFTIKSDCAVVTGRVTNTAGEPLPFANVYIKGTTKGTTTNLEGYYRLEVAKGPCELVYRFMGYKMKVEPVVITDEPLQLDVSLEKENYTLNEVMVRADAEDPAYPIIRKAIDNRKKYLNEVEEFSCDVYIKGIQRLTKYPKKILGMDITLDQFIDTTTGIIYLSESVSRFSFKQPDKINETMVSSKVSGSNRAFSFNKASDMAFNFYENNMMVGELSQRGFISPIAQTAMLYYKYRLDGSFLENGRLINRIEVIPKRKSDPVFAGYLFIQDSTWRIHSLDLSLTKESQIEFVDSLRIGQTFIPATEDEEIWRLGSASFDFVFSAFGFHGNGNFIAVYSGYEIDPNLGKKAYRGAIMKIGDGANKKDSVYWENIRPVPLTAEEEKDYQKRDSLRVIKESKAYLDSLDRVNNKFKTGNLITGYNYRSRFRKTNYTFSGMLDNIQFNTVEGLNIGLNTTVEKTMEKRKSLNAALNVRYGFSNEDLQATGMARYDYNVRKFAYVMVQGGKDLVQFNESKPITPLINTSYTLFGEHNYMKLFSKQFASVATRIEPLNGIRLRANAEYSVRDAVTNSTDYTITDKKSRAYTSNNPTNPLNDQPFFERNEALKIKIDARVRFRREFIDRSEYIYITGSKFPVLFGTYETGISGIGGSDVDYSKFEVGVEDNIRLGMPGTFSYYVVYGDFIRKKNIYFMDVAHFNGNRTFFTEFQQQRFDLLDYYNYSTTTEYVQVFTEHNFGGFIFNKIPGIRKLKLNEIAGFRMLHVPDEVTHYEISFGIEKLGLIRADYVLSFDENGKSGSGFVIGIKTRVGR
jgi:hypothetical protein